jgi:hypothetical protein
MDPISIGAMILSAALSYGAQANAAKKQQQQAAAMRQRQMNAQNEATREASTKAAEFDPGNRKRQQDEIQQDLTGELDRQVSQPQITAQGVEVGTTLDGGGKDYLTAKARETAKSTASLRELAALMGRIGSAGQLRQKEAIGIGDTAGAIGRIQNGAGNMGQIDQIGINAVQPSPGMMLASEALSAYGSGAFGGGKPATKYPEYGKASGPTGAWL